MDEEEWRWIPGLESAYQVSTHGRVRSFLRVRAGRITIENKFCAIPHFINIRPSRNKRYLDVHLKFNQKPRIARVHALVLEAFVGPRPSGHDAAHLDGVRTNNHLSNLAWATKKVNSSHRRLHGTAPRRVLTDQHVFEIRRLYVYRKFGARMVANALRLNANTVRGVISGASFAWLGPTLISPSDFTEDSV